MKGISEIVGFLLLIVVGVVVGGWCLVQLYLLFGAWFGLMAATIARLLGFDVQFGADWIIWTAILMILIGVGIGTFEYVQRRGAKKRALR